MSPILSNDVVQLADDLPELKLHAGDRGIVRTAWYFPNVAFEVEFGREHGIKLLLLPDQLLVGTDAAQ
jgi:hypothetical protein